MMNLKNIMVLIAASQLVSVTMTVAIIAFDWSYRLSEEWVMAIGNTLTLLLLAVGIATHIQAKKGSVIPALIAVLCLFGPVYACLGGLLRHVAGYHAVSLGVCAFVAWNVKKLEQAAPRDDA